MSALEIINTGCSIAGLLISIFLATQVISIKKSIKDNSNNTVEQKHSSSQGDMAGRDINKRNHE